MNSKWPLSRSSPSNLSPALKSGNLLWLVYLFKKVRYVHVVCQESSVIYRVARVLSLISTFTLLHLSKFAPAPGSLKNVHANCKMHSEPRWLIPLQLKGTHGWLHADDRKTLPGTCFCTDKYNALVPSTSEIKWKHYKILVY